MGCVLAHKGRCLLSPRQHRSSFFAHFCCFFLDTSPFECYNNIKSKDLRKRNRIRGNFILSFADMSENAAKMDLFLRSCFGCFFIGIQPFMFLKFY